MSPQIFPVFFFRLYLRCLNQYQSVRKVSFLGLPWGHIGIWYLSRIMWLQMLVCRWYRPVSSFYSLHICFAWVNMKKSLFFSLPLVIAGPLPFWLLLCFTSLSDFMEEGNVKPSVHTLLTYLTSWRTQPVSVLVRHLLLSSANLTAIEVYTYHQIVNVCLDEGYFCVIGLHFPL